MSSAVEITKHGTFLGSLTPRHREVYQQLPGVLGERIETDAERSEILSALRASIGSAEVSNFVKDSAGQFQFSHQELDWLSRRPASRWVDYLIYRYRFKNYPAKRKLLDFPLHLLIEPTSVCNLRCVMCFQVDESFTKPGFMGIMPWELFTKVVDEARENQCHAVTLASRGEPTLHKQFGKMLRYLNDAGVMDVKINTNATKMTEALCHDILASNVSEVVFSVDASTKETYEKIRVKGIFEEVVENVRLFNATRQAHYPESPTITRISGVKVSDEQDLEQMSRYWSERVDEVTIKEAIPRWDSYNNSANKITEPCSVLWERTYVWYDGTVNPCDFDYKSYLAVGNAKDSSIRDLWTGEKYSQLREAHLSKLRHTRTPCDRCPLS